MDKKDLINLLRVCSKMTLDKGDEEVIFNCLKNFEENIADILEKHKIHLLFLKHIDKLSCADRLNKALREKYSNQLFCLQFKYEEYLMYLKNVANRQESQNVKYAVLKGFSFMDSLYMCDGIVYRPFADVDILISRSDIKRTDDILKEMGLIQGRILERNIIPANRQDIIYWELNSHQLHEYISFSKYSKISPTYRIEFDINTTIFEGGKKIDPIIPEKILCHRIKKKCSDGVQFYCLDFTFGLLQLCYHFYKDTKYEVKKFMHDDYCLLKFCDIREYVLKYKNEINWNEFISVVNASGIGKQIHYSLWNVSKFYGDLGIDSILQHLETSGTDCDQDINWELLL